MIPNIVRQMMEELRDEMVLRTYHASLLGAFVHPDMTDEQFMAAHQKAAKLARLAVKEGL